MVRGGKESSKEPRSERRVHRGQPKPLTCNASDPDHTPKTGMGDPPNFGCHSTGPDACYHDSKGWSDTDGRRPSPSPSHTTRSVSSRQETGTLRPRVPLVV